jgi:hypothetical protein
MPVSAALATQTDGVFCPADIPVIRNRKAQHIKPFVSQQIGQSVMIHGRTCGDIPAMPMKDLPHHRQAQGVAIVSRHR